MAHAVACAVIQARTVPTFQAVTRSESLIGLGNVPDPPRHLVLGAFGVDVVSNKLKATLAELEVWRGVGIATDYPMDDIN